MSSPLACQAPCLSSPLACFKVDPADGTLSCPRRSNRAASNPTFSTRRENGRFLGMNLRQAAQLESDQTVEDVGAGAGDRPQPEELIKATRSFYRGSF